MSKATGPVPADEVPQWPLALGLGLLALTAYLNMRLGREQVALVLVSVAAVIPIVGIFLRSYLRFAHPGPARVRRVVVGDDSPVATVRLETAKYLTPAPQPGLRAPADPVEGSAPAGLLPVLPVLPFPGTAGQPGP